MTASPRKHQLAAYVSVVPRPDPKSGDPIAWLKNRALPQALVEAFLSVPLFRGIQVGRAGDKRMARTTIEKAKALVATGGEVYVELQDRADVLEKELSVTLDLRDGGVAFLRCSASGAAFDAHRATALDDLVAAIQRARESLGRVAWFDIAHIKYDDTSGQFDYPRTRPPRESNRYPERSLVTFIDRAFHASGHDRARPAHPNALTVPPPPPPATTTEDGDLVTVRWARTLDDHELARAASGHDAWIAERVETDISFGFDERGDLHYPREDAQPAQPLTFYERANELGYKAVLVLPDGSVDKSGWDAAKKVLDAKMLPDGSPVASVMLVVPLREHAFQIADEAKQAGFEALLYADAEGEFWNPDPPGMWLTPPVGAPARTTGARPRRR